MSLTSSDTDLDLIFHQTEILSPQSPVLVLVDFYAVQLHNLNMRTQESLRCFNCISHIIYISTVGVGLQTLTVEQCLGFSPQTLCFICKEKNI